MNFELFKKFFFPSRDSNGQGNKGDSEAEEK